MAVETAGGLAARLAPELERVRAGVPLRAYLRPAKWTGALRRRSFRAQLPAAVELHRCAGVEHVGTSYGGWPAPIELLDSNSIVYSVGAGRDISFDLGLIERLGCEVHSFDPTAGAAEYVRTCAHERLEFHNLAIWTRDGTLRMHRAADPTHIALSAVNLQKTSESVDVPCRTIESIRRELGHERIDRLKLTVDGGEYELLPTLQLDSWGTRVLVVAFHHNHPARAAVDAIAALADSGMVPVARRDTAFTFVRHG
jgi:FkbM family methyltransferase